MLDVERYLAGIGDPIDQLARRAFDADILDATARSQGIRVRLGDMVLIRTGWLRYVLQEMEGAARARFRQDRRHIACPGLDQNEACCGGCGSTRCPSLPPTTWVWRRCRPRVRRRS